MPNPDGSLTPQEYEEIRAQALRDAIAIAQRNQQLAQEAERNG